MSYKPPKPVLYKEQVYLGDNGQVFCGGCAGMSALYTGRDISGQKVEPVPPNYPLGCEGCGRTQR